MPRVFEQAAVNIIDTVTEIEGYIKGPIIVLSKDDCKKVLALMKNEFINQNEEPGKSAYPILKAIMEFGSNG